VKAHVKEDQTGSRPTYVETDRVKRNKEEGIVGWPDKKRERYSGKNKGGRGK